MVLGSGASGSHVGRGLISGISFIIKETSERSLAPSLLPCEDKGKRCWPGTKRQAFIDTKSAAILGILASKTMKNKFLLFISHTAYGILL